MKPYKSAVKRGGAKVLAFCIKVEMSFFTAFSVSRPLIDAAARERGHYGAFGGEWFLIIGVFVLTYYLTSRAIRPP